MGLDDFTTSSSSSNSPSGGLTGKQKPTSGSGSSTRNRDVDPMKPYFTAIIDTRYDSVRIFEGKEAFEESSRHKYENVLCVIEDEESFERLNDISVAYTDKELEELFRTQPLKGEDLVKRQQRNNVSKENVRCPVCGDTIIMDSDDYTKVFNELVHADHDVELVVSELDEE